MSVAAAGMLQAVCQATGSLATWRDASQAFAAPTNLAVLAAVVQGQPQLHARVRPSFEVLGSCSEGNQVVRDSAQGASCQDAPRNIQEVSQTQPSLLGLAGREGLAVLAAVVQGQPQLHARVSTQCLFHQITTFQVTIGSGGQGLGWRITEETGAC